jgi:ATP phosphoribosyltransferase
MKTLALPNGSLYEATSSLLAKVGITLESNGRKFISGIKGSEIFDQAIIMRPQDMPEALVDGMADAAIYGYDWHEESGLSNELKVITELNYSKTTDQPVKLVIFGKCDELIDSNDVLVTTEYPKLTAKFFQQAKIRFSHGGTEQKVAYGKYDYGVCVTETGKSLKENGLKIMRTILISPTVLVAKEKTAELAYFGELLAGGLKAAKYRLIKMNSRENILPDILSLLPSLEAPTVNKLSNGDYAVESVVPQNIICDLIVNLKTKGANGILVQGIELVC